MGIFGLARRIHRQLRRDRLAHDDRTRFSQQGNCGGIVGWRAPCMERRAVFCGHILGVKNILYTNRDTVKRPRRLPAPALKVGFTRLLQRIFRVKVLPCANRALTRLDAIQAGLNQLFGRGLTQADCRRGFGGAHLKQIHRFHPLNLVYHGKLDHHSDTSGTSPLSQPKRYSGSHKAICGNRYMSSIANSTMPR